MEYTHEQCIREARRLAATKEWVNDYVLARKLSAYTPGDQVVLYSVERGILNPLRFYVVGSYKGKRFRDGSGFYLLTSDGKRISASGLLHYVDPKVAFWNNGVIKKQAQDLAKNVKSLAPSSTHHGFYIGKSFTNAEDQEKVKECLGNIKLLADMAEEASGEETGLVKALRRKNTAPSLLRTLKTLITFIKEYELISKRRNKTDAGATT